MAIGARVWFGATALVVAVALIVQVRAVAQLDSGFFDTDAKRIANIACFFTIWSNVLVGITSGLLALRLDRRSRVFRTAYLTAVLMIVVTFVVVIVALDPITRYEGKAAAADFLTHKLVPVLALAGWIVFGPRGMVDKEVARATIVVPLVWIGFTLARGPLAGDYYPYPFVDVDELGYLRVLANVVVITALFLGLGAAASWADRRLPARLPTHAAAGPTPTPPPTHPNPPRVPRIRRPWGPPSPTSSATTSASPRRSSSTGPTR